jgi:isocitrate dehydrogenase (NAD+)
MSAILMLRHIDENDAANRVEKAMLDVFLEGKTLTKDLGGTAKTADFANAIIDKIKPEASAAT